MIDKLQTCPQDFTITMKKLKNYRLVMTATKHQKVRGAPKWIHSRRAHFQARCQALLCQRQGPHPTPKKGKNHHQQ